MGVAAYAVIGSGGEWRTRHDGKNENVYQRISVRGGSSRSRPQARSRDSDQRSWQRNGESRSHLSNDLIAQSL
jgi:hypothetical protein